MILKFFNNNKMHTSIMVGDKFLSDVDNTVCIGNIPTNWKIEKCSDGVMISKDDLYLDLDANNKLMLHKRNEQSDTQKWIIDKYSIRNFKTRNDMSLFIPRYYLSEFQYIGKHEELNILSTTCTSARMMRAWCSKFNNPFVWGIMDSSSFFRLLQLYNTIDFYNVEFKLTLDNYVSVCIDGGVTFKYIHNKYTEKEEEIVNGPFVYSKDIINYTKEKYFKRLKNMTNDLKKIAVFDLTNEEYSLHETLLKTYDKIPFDGKKIAVLPEVDKDIKISTSIQCIYYKQSIEDRDKTIYKFMIDNDIIINH